MKRNQAKEITEQKILQVSIDLFSKYGFASTSIRNIATRAGISVGLLYHYFKTKEVLLTEIFKRCLLDVNETFKLETKEFTIADYIRNNFAVLNKNKALWRLIYMLRTQDPVLNVLAPEIEALQNKVIRNMELLLKDEYKNNALKEAYLLHASIEGLVFHYLFDKNFPLDDALHQLLKKYEK